MFMSTTEEIYNYRKLRHGGTKWVEASGDTISEALSLAEKMIESEVELLGYNALVGMRYSFQIDAMRKVHVLVTGTLLEIEDYPGYMEICEKVKERFDIEFPAKYCHLNQELKEQAFWKACEKSDMEMAKEIYKMDIDIHRENGMFFERACRYANLKTVQWLYELGKYNILNYEDNIFISVCEAGNLEIAKWLCRTEVEKHPKVEEAFIAAVRNCHVDVARWLGKKVFVTDLERKGIDLSPEDWCSDEQIDEMDEWLRIRRRENY